MRIFSKRFITLFVLVGAVGLMVISPSLWRAQMGPGGMGGGGTGSGGMGSGFGMGSSYATSRMSNGMGAIMLISGEQGYRNDGKMLQMSDAITLAQNYLTALNNANLALDEVEEWEYNFYVVVEERSTSNKAFQLTIDKWTGAVMPEPGPNMMWNAKYLGNGMSMRSEVFGSTSGTNSPMTVSASEAGQDANQFLAARFSGRNLAVVNPPDTYYGFYSFDVNDVATGKKYGMLSVNGYTGQVWYHTWHGNFIQGQEISN